MAIILFLLVVFTGLTVTEFFLTLKNKASYNNIIIYYAAIAMFLFILANYIYYSKECIQIK